ncbi:MAG: hypothetical protein R3E94_05815 [Burkholderiaceae bacterium]
MQATTATHTTDASHAGAEMVPVIRGDTRVMVPANEALQPGDRVVTGDQPVNVLVRNAAGTKEAVVRVAPHSEILVKDPARHVADQDYADIEVITGEAVFLEEQNKDVVTLLQTGKSVLAGGMSMLDGVLLGGAGLLAAALSGTGGGDTGTQPHSDTGTSGTPGEDPVSISEPNTETTSRAVPKNGDDGDDGNGGADGTDGGDGTGGGSGNDGDDGSDGTDVHHHVHHHHHHHHHLHTHLQGEPGTDPTTDPDTDPDTGGSDGGGDSNPDADAGPTLLSGASSISSSGTDGVSTLLEDAGLSGLSAVPEDVVDPMIEAVAHSLDGVVIGQDGESGLTGAVEALGDQIAASGDGIPVLDPVIQTAGDLVSDLGSVLNTMFNQDLLDSETPTTGQNVGDDLLQLADNLTSNVDGLLGDLLGTDPLLEPLLDGPADALLSDTLGDIMSSAGSDATLTDGVAHTVDNVTDVIDSLAGELGLQDLSQPVTSDIVDQTVSTVTDELDGILIGNDSDPGLLDQIQTAGDEVASAGDGTSLDPILDLLGHAVGNTGSLGDTTLNQDLLVSETGTGMDAIADELSTTADVLTNDTDTLLDSVLGTETLTSDLLDGATSSLLGDTTAELLDTSQASPSTEGDLTLPLVDAGNLLGDLANPLAYGT